MAEVNETTDTGETGERAKRDPELLAIERCARMLADLDPDAQRRAVLWLSDRFGTRPA